MKIKQFTIFALILFTMPANIAFAHKVIVFAWVEDGMVYTESSFGSKRKAKGCTIKIVDEKGKIIHIGQTDGQGNYSFEIPKKVDSDFIVKLDAGTGHQAQWRIPENELVAIQSTKDSKAVMTKKEKLKESPSIFKIMGGIGIIFMLALALKCLKRKTPSSFVITVI